MPTSGTATTPLAVPVSLTVSPNPSLNIASTALTFYYQTATSLPAAQTVAMTSSGSQLNFNVSSTTQKGGSWLVVSPTGGLTTPQTLTVAIASGAASLPADTYTGTISVSAAGASNPSQTISVTLVVSATPLLVVSGPLSTFAYQTGAGNPPNQTLQLTTTSTAASYTANIAFTAGQNWLTVGPASGSASAAAPQTLTFSVNPAGLAPGDYTATVTISSKDTTNTISLPVNLTVSNGTVIGPTVGFLLFNFQTTQSPPAAQIFQVYSSGAQVTYTAAVTTNNCGANWLAVTPGTGTTSPNTTMTVSVNVAGITAPQTCTGSVTLSSPDAANKTAIPVTLNVSSTALLNATPTAMFFNASAANLTPPVQNISLTATDNSAVGFTASAASGGGNWLFLSGATGLTT
ncbi:MAG: BACON domain-containing protein, partial [Bryobacteraceae bacterium]